MKRFQECNWLGKLWRYRWYLLIPFKWIWHMVFSPMKVYRDEWDEDGDIVHTEEYDIMIGRNLWKLLIGSVQYKMGWYYTHEEVISKFKYLDNDEDYD
jgi:hypothetical protein